MTDDLPPGSRVGPYAIAERLAAGGFGTVYRASGGEASEPVAIKVLHAFYAGDGSAVLRFSREAAVLGRVAHPGIVRRLDGGQLADGRPWFAMELLAGRDLAHELADGGRWPEERAIAMIRAVAGVLAAAHAAGVVHRDVKASNVFLVEDGRTVLLDFGVAKLLDQNTDVSTKTGRLVGTPASMAPEQLRGLPVDARTDVYGLGALLFHAVAGQRPFAAYAAEELRWSHLYARRPLASEHAPVRPVLDDIIARAMAIDPADRFPDVGALTAALGRLG